MQLIRSVAVLRLLTLSFACTKDSLDDPTPESGTEDERIVWVGDNITFNKANAADPSLEENQDRITDLVWITRDNGGGQIYNAKSESQAESGSSPRGTLWAIGSIDEIDDLDFRTFRSAVGKPKNVVGKDLVLQLVEEKIFIQLKFTSWSNQGGGGFAYERSSPE